MTSSHTPWDDAQLMAWADGQLAAEESALLEAAFANDAAMAERAAQMQLARAFVRDAFDARLAQDPVPPALRASVEAMVARHQQALASAAPANEQPPARQPMRQQRPWWFAWRDALAGLALPGAVAASVVVGGLGFLLGQTRGGGGPVIAQALVVGEPAPSELAGLLSRLPSGQQAVVDSTGATLAMVASFNDAQGRLCRDFSLQSANAPQVEAVACRRPGSAWQIAFAAVQPPVQGSFTPAGPQSAVEAYLADINASKPLDEQAERRALDGR